MSATVYFRKRGRFFSVEEVFGAMVAHLDESVVRARCVTAPVAGARAGTLLRNIMWARREQGQVNHVTGDIHYVVLGLDPARTVLTVLDTRPITGRMSAKKLLLQALWFRWPVRRAAVVVAISEETRRELLRYVPARPDKVRVVPCCLPAHFQSSPRAFPESQPTILQVGTTDNKNLLRLADALQGLDCRVVVLGTPDAAQQCRFRERGVTMEWVSGLDSDEVMDLYRRCDVVSFASTYEGFGMPIIEANAVGRPVLTSNCSSMPEVAGDAALLVDPFDVGSIRAGMQRLLGCPSLREELVARGRRNAERFRPEAVARQYAELYREVAVEATRT